MIGSKGTDLLVGGPQADTLVAAQGDQTLTGLGGADQFVFNDTGIQATITDFDPSRDVLVFGNALGADPLHNIQSHDGNAVIHTGGDTITLNNVNPHDLNATNIVVHS